MVAGIFHCKIRRIIPQLPQFIHLGCYGGPCEDFRSAFQRCRRGVLQVWQAVFFNGET